jgi:hypothetical protein
VEEEGKRQQETEGADAMNETEYKERCLPACASKNSGVGFRV